MSFPYTCSLVSCLCLETSKTGNLGLSQSPCEKACDALASGVFKAASPRCSHRGRPGQVGRGAGAAHTALDIGASSGQLRPDAAGSLGSGAVPASVDRGWLPGRRNQVGQSRRHCHKCAGCNHPGIFYPTGGFEPTVSGALRPRSPSRHALTQAGKCGEARGPRGCRGAAPAR